MSIGIWSALLANIVFNISGLMWMIFTRADADYAVDIFVPLVLIGIGRGLGLGLSPLNSLAITEVPIEDVGAASDVINTVHQAGAALGISVIAWVISLGLVYGAEWIQVVSDSFNTANLRGAA